MANYRPKGKGYMRQLGRKGGVESGRTRWGKRVARLIYPLMGEAGIILCLFEGFLDGLRETGGARKEAMPEGCTI